MITPEWVQGEAAALAGAPPEELLAWAVRSFPGRAGLTCSFGGPGLDLAHILSRNAPDTPVILLETDILFPETLALKEEFRRRYFIRLVELHPLLSPAEQAARYGDRLWESDPDRCCALRKLEPMQRALAGLDAWIAGIRRQQSTTRAGASPLEYHLLPDGRPVVKVQPLADWDQRQVWSYITANGLPCNPLLDQGYSSIGCTHCTRPVQPGEDERAGRWSGTGKTECGLHTFTRRVGAGD